MSSSTVPKKTPAADGCLAGGGEMGALMRSMDWSKTALGPVESWSQSLCTSVSTCLNSRFPILIWWGPELIKIYNDAYRQIIANKHPRSMGQRGRDCWPELWHIIGPMLEGVLAHGQATWSENQLLVLERHGFPEECYFTFSYSPIRDEGGIAGVFSAVTETTWQVLGERRLKTLRDLGERALVDSETVEQACRAGMAKLADNPYDFSFALIYLLDEEGRHARLLETVNLPAGTDTGPRIIAIDGSADIWNLRGVIETNRAQVVENLEEKIGRLRSGVWADDWTKRALVLPLAKAGVQEFPSGILVVGLSPRLALNHEYRSFLELAAGQLATAIANARAYEEERKRAEGLAELDRAKTAFFSNVSHEFRTPLTLMLGPLEEALAHSEGLQAADRERLELAHRNSVRLLKLVNTLLDFSRIEAGRIQASYQPTDLAAFTEELASVFRSAIERAGLRLVVDCRPLPEAAFVDREMWEKIVLNLLSNAFKFTFEGEIDVSLRQAGEMVELAVRDTGTGIPAEELPRIFDRFHRIKGARGRTFEGSGIGLALVQELAKLHGGVTRVDSEVDRGSTFTVTIPLGKGHLPADRIEAPRTLASTGVAGEAFLGELLRWLPEEPAQAGAAAPSEKLVREVEPHRSIATPGPLPRILLADDNADMRDYLRRLLSRQYEVEAVADGRAAVRAARDRVPDLVLADVMMPELDGFGLLRELRADPLTATVPVIMLSARSGEEERSVGLEAGADDYVIKPFSARELLARVESHVKMARFRSEASDALRQSEEQYRRLVGLLPVAVYTCEAPTGVITFYNDHAAKLWGRAPQPGATDERFCGSFQLWRLDGTPLPHDQAPMALAIREGREFRNEDVIIERPDGTRINVLVNINPIRAETGHVIGAINAFQDTTALKRAQDLVEEQRRVLELTTEAAQVGTWQWNIQTGELIWSAIHKQLWGYEAAGSLTYQDWARLLDRKDLEQAERVIEQCLRTRTDYDIEYRIQPGGGTGMRWIRSIGRPVFNEAQEAVLMRGVSFDITTRKEAENALRDSEERLAVELAASQALQAVSTQMIQEGDVEALYGQVLDAAVAIMRSEMASIQMVDEGQDALRLLAFRGFDPEFQKVFGLNWPHARTSCSVARRLGRRVVVPDVETCDFLVGTPALEDHRKMGIRAVQSTPLISRDGQLLGMISTHWSRPHQPAERELRLLDVLARQAADLIDRKRAEEWLRYRTAQFETLLNQAPLGVFLVDANFRIREVNPIALPVFGDIPGGVLGRDFNEIVHVLWEKQYADELVQIFRHTLETGEPYITPERAEFRIDRGVTEYYEWRLDRLTLPDGRHGLVCYFRDISEQVKARQMIAESEQRFRAIADAMPQIVWAARPDGQIDYYNERWFEYTGLPRGEFGPSNWESILHPDDLRRSKDTYFDCIREGKPYQIECRFKARESEEYRWFMGRALPIRDEKGRVVRWFGTFTDIDDQKRLEAELRQADRRKDEFLAMLGHELRNPLAAISSGTALLQSNPSQDRRAWVEQMMERQVVQLRRLVDDLLDVTRITQGKIHLRKEAIELAKPVEAAVESVRDLFEARRHRFSVSLPPEPLLLLADPARMEQILVNLLANAAKYTPKEGQISLSAERSGSELIIRCRDNGIGIPPEMLDSVFESFVQINSAVDHSASGLGMGLTLVKRLVEMHGGTVTASSEGPGTGSEFTLRLPALSMDETGPPEKAEASPGTETTAPTAMRILVIDDNRDLAEGLVLFLRDAGHRVAAAHDGETGIAVAEREPPEVVLLDLGLPGMDGYAVAANLRATPALKDTTIIAISGYKPLDDERTRRARFDAHLVKPIAYDQLLKLLGEKRAARQLAQVPPSARRILLIEDNRELALLTAELLRNHGQEVLVAFDGEEGLRKAREFRPEIVFCDLNLPGRDGFETARLLRQEFAADLPLVVGLTADRVDAYQSCLDQTPFDLFLSKPLVWSKIRDILAGHGQRSPTSRPSPTTQ